MTLQEAKELRKNIKNTESNNELQDVLMRLPLQENGIRFQLTNQLLDAVWYRFSAHELAQKFCYRILSSYAL